MEVAVRMISTYLPLGLVCWTIGKQVERALNNRVADLDRGLRELLKDPEISRLVKQVYNHGMISGRFKVQSEPSRGQSIRPSYIPSRDLALAVMGIALPNNSSLARVVRGSFAVDRFRPGSVIAAMDANCVTIVNDLWLRKPQRDALLAAA